MKKLIVLSLLSIFLFVTSVQAGNIVRQIGKEPKYKTIQELKVGESGYILTKSLIYNKEGDLENIDSEYVVLSKPIREYNLKITCINNNEYVIDWALIIEEGT